MRCVWGLNEPAACNRRQECAGRTDSLAVRVSVCECKLGARIKRRLFICESSYYLRLILADVFPTTAVKVNEVDVFSPNAAAAIRRSTQRRRANCNGVRHTCTQIPIGNKFCVCARSDSEAPPPPTNLFSTAACAACAMRSSAPPVAVAVESSIAHTRLLGAHCGRIATSGHEH